MIYLTPLIVLANLLHRHFKKIKLLTTQKDVDVALGEFCGFLQTVQGIRWNRDVIPDVFKPFVEKYGVDITDVLYNAVIKFEYDTLKEEIDKLTFEYSRNMPYFKFTFSFAFIHDFIKFKGYGIEDLEMFIYAVLSSLYPVFSLEYAVRLDKLEDINMMLDVAAQNGNLVDVLNFENSENLTLLVYAIHFSKLEAIKMMLDIAAQNGNLVNVLNFEDSKYVTPLVYAIHFSKLEAIKMMLGIAAQNGNLVNVLNFEDSENCTQLKYAIELDKLEVIKMILDVAAQNGNLVDVLNFEDSKYMTPLVYAIHFSKLEAIKMMSDVAVQNGNLVDVLNFEDSENWTPLKYAIELDKLEAIKMILDVAAQNEIFDSIDAIKELCKEDYNCTLQTNNFTQEYGKSSIDGTIALGIGENSSFYSEI